MALLVAVVLPDWALATEIKLLSKVFMVGALLRKPTPPIHNSFAWVVIGVVPVTGEVLLPPGDAAVWSTALAVKIPLYSITTPAQRPERVAMVTLVAAPEPTGADQISVVLPLLLADCATRAQVAPVEVMPVTRSAVVPRDEITATRVLPLAGEALRVTVNEVLLEPELKPVALRTRTGVA